MGSSPFPPNTPGHIRAQAVAGWRTALSQAEGQMSGHLARASGHPLIRQMQKAHREMEAISGEIAAIAGSVENDSGTPTSRTTVIPPGMSFQQQMAARMRGEL